MLSFTLDLVDLDVTVDPATDFYRFANGGWLARNPLPAEESRYGTFDLLTNSNKEKLRDLFEEFSKDTFKTDDPSFVKVVGFFKLALNEEKSNQAGISPILPFLERIRSLASFDAVVDEIIFMHTKGLAPLFNFYGAPDMKNSSWVIPELYQGGLGLSDKDYYTDFDARAVKIRSEYWQYMQTCFLMAGHTNELSIIHANNVMEVETALAEFSMSRLDQRNPYNTYHKYNLTQLVDLCPGFNWEHFFSELGITYTEEFNVGQPDFFSGLKKLIKEFPIEKWISYLEWNWVNGFAPYLSQDFVEHHFKFYGKTLSGKEVIQPRWKRAVQATNQALGMLVGRFYVQKHFPATSKKRMLELVGNLKNAMASRIKSLDWMTSETKDKALEKLQKMKLKIGYPDKWKDYSALEIREDSYALNILRSLSFEHSYNMSKIGKPVDPDEWGMTPQTVNAYYNPNLNEIVFPAAILQPPFFYPEGDDAINYGAIGMIIGHEMTHGFDDQGRHFDAEGNLTDWWSEEDSTNFKNRTKVLVDQFNNYLVLPELKANGELTLGENIADLGGLNIALSAYLDTHPDHQQDIINGLSGLQRFFISYARVWANSIRVEEVLRRTKEDVHSLGELRVNGPLPNIELFYKAFDIKPGDRMYMEPELRAHIW